MEFWHSPTRFTTPSSSPRVNRSVLSKKRLLPIVLGISGQPYKLHLTLFSPRIVHVRFPEGFLASQLNLGILGKFHKLQHQTLLVSNYLQQSHKYPNLITVAFNCLPEDLSNFALLQSQSKHTHKFSIAIPLWCNITTLLPIS
ncbi:hypothetical protein QL285_008468 [Trifolium repens]|nr:hypothetical protein QL285_008468 [Trifolium repens]